MVLLAAPYRSDGIERICPACADMLRTVVSAFDAITGRARRRLIVSWFRRWRGVPTRGGAELEAALVAQA